MRDWRRMLSHRFCTAGDLIDRLRPCALRRERRKKGRILRRCGLAVHDLIHHGICFFIAEVAFSYNFLDRFFDHNWGLRF